MRKKLGLLNVRDKRKEQMKDSLEKYTQEMINIDYQLKEIEEKSKTSKLTIK